MNDRAARVLKTFKGDWKQHFARGLGKDYATVKRWAAGELPWPDYAVAVIELLERVPLDSRPPRWVPETSR